MLKGENFMDILMLGNDPADLAVCLGLQLICTDNIKSFVKKTQQSHPLFLLIDFEYLAKQDWRRLLDVPADIPTVFLADTIPQQSFDLVCHFRPFCMLQHDEFLSDSAALLSELSRKSMKLYHARIQDNVRQMLLETDGTFAAHSSLFYVRGALLSRQICGLLQAFSLSSVYVICLCSSALLLDTQYRMAQEIIGKTSSCLFMFPFQEDLFFLAKKVDQQILSELLQKIKQISAHSEYGIGISKRIAVTETMDLVSGFHQAKLATEINFYEKTEIACYSDSLFSLAHDHKILISYEKELTNAILMGYQETKLLTILEGYIQYFRENRIKPSLVYDAVYRYLNSLDRVFKFIDPLCSIDLSLISLEDVAAEGTLEKLHASLAEMLIDFLRKGEHYEQTSDNLLREIQSYIDNHLDKAISLSDIEQEFYVNKFVFCRQFKKFTGQTFNKYVKTARLQNALSLLKNTDIKIYEIAHRLGFRDESYFGVIFKKEFGISPSEYRIQNQTKR